ncbi:hypothetical protein L5515_016460 [Caenorhabditis briggsae]|uniref:Uncharacterized protein n=1 Tax=Caenorhabditis briggsae TaxID=6238 RepID=A0AAE9F5Z9_CAEBR|nr:hypothetical protein L5515_016460 [Caenorhabditis briggsae]
MNEMKMGDCALKNKAMVQKQKKKRLCIGVCIDNPEDNHAHFASGEHTEERIDVHAGEVGCCSIGDEYQVSREV